MKTVCIICKREASDNRPDTKGMEGMVSHGMCAKCTVCDEEHGEHGFVGQDPVTFAEKVKEFITAELGKGIVWSGPEKKYPDEMRARLFDKFYKRVKEQMNAELDRR